jgi:electron transfer flavoprotein alpha subunit
MSKLLVIAFDGHESAAAGGFAQSLGMDFDLLVLQGEGHQIGQGRSFAANLQDIPPADATASGLATLVTDYTHIASVSSMRSKDVLGRLAGLLDAPMVTDAIAIDSPTRFRRPIVAGSMVETVEIAGSPVIVTFRPAGFAKVASLGPATAEPAIIPLTGQTQRVSTSELGGGRPDLSQAKVIISGGRPLKDAETFERVIGGFADAVGGAAGATRAAVDSGIAANELQVGQTGKIVAPDLYIAAGVSGSTQHMAGIKDSKVIVAINTDGDAPIFEIADFGLVQDLFTAVPELQGKLGR